MSSKRKLTVAVTGLNNTDNPGPGIPVIRALRESEEFDVRIIGLAYENLEPGIYMHDLVDKTYRVPYPSEGSDILVNRVLEISKIEKLDVLIPNFDAELMAFMKSTGKNLQMQEFIPFFLSLISLKKGIKITFLNSAKNTVLKVPAGKPVPTLRN